MPVCSICGTLKVERRADCDCGATHCGPAHLWQHQQDGCGLAKWERELLDEKAGAKRVVLVKPGDVLLVGNVGPITAEQADKLSDAWSELGIRFVVFVGDIDIDALSAENLARLVSAEADGVTP